jgi:rhodanese-related sulfurtransferase
MTQQSENCIAPEILKQELEKGTDVLVIDVRSKDEFDEMHIPLSLNIPIDILEREIRKFDAHYTLVLVCGKGGGRSASAAEKLQLMGREAKWLCGGTLGYFNS